MRWVLPNLISSQTEDDDDDDDDDEVEILKRQPLSAKLAM
jgi:hypothetical protein